jgi:hypothetical protein
VIVLHSAALLATLLTVARVVWPIFNAPSSEGDHGRAIALIGLMFVLPPILMILSLDTALVVAGLMRWRLGSRWLLVAADLPIPLGFLALELFVDPGGLVDLLQTAPWLASGPALFAVALIATALVPPPVSPGPRRV